MDAEPTITQANTTEPVSAPVTERNPWAFVPTLYFMQGLPVVIVQQLSVTMYKTMGVDNAQIGLWTSLIAWPWVVKMLWGPLVDHNGTKRAWIVVTQALIIAALGMVVLGLPSPAFLAITLGLLFVVAFLSATHDIAADGFYLLALKEKDQAFFVGIRSTAFRLAAIFVTGGLVILAGRLQAGGTPVAQSWMAAIGVGTAFYAGFYLYGLWAYPKPALDEPKKRADLKEILGSFGQVIFMLVAIMLFARLLVILAAGLNQVFVSSGWLPSMIVTPGQYLTPLFLPAYAGHGEGIEPFPFMSPTLVVHFVIQLVVSILLIALAVFSSARLFEKIGMRPAAREYFSQQRIWAVLGFILFYRFGESMVGKMSSPFLLDPPDKGGLGVNTQAVGVIIGTVGVAALTLGGILGGLIIAKWGIKRSIWPMVLSLNVPNLFYLWLATRRPVSPLSEMIASDKVPFAHIDVGTNQVLDFIANVPSQIYNLFLLIGLALRDPIGQVIFTDQFGYGFGFSAYMVYLMFVAQGTRHQTSNYAISTGLMALGAMIAGIASGYLQTWLGYRDFFLAVLLLGIPGMITLFFIPMNKQDIRTAPVDLD